MLYREIDVIPLNYVVPGLILCEAKFDFTEIFLNFGIQVSRNLIILFCLVTLCSPTALFWKASEGISLISM